MEAPSLGAAPGQQFVLAAVLPTAVAGWQAGAARLQPACTAVPVDASFIQKFRHGEVSRAHWLLQEPLIMRQPALDNCAIDV
jgi:hypothetical protein